MNTNVNLKQTGRRIPWAWIFVTLLLIIFSAWVHHDLIAGAVDILAFLAGYTLAYTIIRRISKQTRVGQIVTFMVVLFISFWLILPPILGTPLTSGWEVLLNLSTGFVIGLVLVNPRKKTSQVADKSESVQ